MKFPLPAVIEKTEGRVASLLDLSNHQSRTDGMDRARWHENGVVLPDRMPLDQLCNRAVLDGRSLLRGGKLPLQSDGNFGSGCGGKNIPSLGLAVRHAN